MAAEDSDDGEYMELNNCATPSYLADELRRVSDMPERQHLRSASTAALDVPVTRRSTIGDRSFSRCRARLEQFACRCHIGPVAVSFQATAEDRTVPS